MVFWSKNNFSVEKIPKKNLEKIPRDPKSDNFPSCPFSSKPRPVGAPPGRRPNFRSSKLGLRIQKMVSWLQSYRVLRFAKRAQRKATRLVARKHVSLRHYELQFGDTGSKNVQTKRLELFDFGRSS